MSISQINLACLIVAGVFLLCGNSVEVRAQSMKELFEARSKAVGLDGTVIGTSSSSMYSYFIMLGEDELNRLRGTKQLSPEEQLQLAALENALKKVLDYKKQSLAGVEGLLYSDVLRELTADSTTADKIFQALGEARMQELVQNSVVISLQMKTSMSADNSHTLNNFLSMESVANAIGLSDSQKEKIKKLSEETARELRTGPPKPIKNLESAIEKHWRYVLSVLSGKQRREAKRLVGSPFRWHRSFVTPQIRKMDFAVVFREHFSTACYELTKKLNKKRPADLTAEEMSDAGIEFIHAHWAYIMESRIAWDEFEFTDTQRESAKKQFRDYWLKEGYLTSRKHRERLAQLLADKTAEYPAILKEILLDHQLDYLKQLEFQVLTNNKYETSFGMLHPMCIESLVLDSDQVQKLEKASKAFQKERQELEQTLADEREKIRVEFAKDLSEILTPEQREQFKSLLGFDVAASTKK